MARGFEVRELEAAGVRTLVLTGELDLASSGVLVAAISKACAEGAQSIVLDIGALEFIDSTGVREIVAGQALCHEHGASFQLTRGGPRVERVFEVAGLLDFFSPRRTEGEPADVADRPGDAVGT
jgi:anti-sigma B factor antagonist